MRCERFRRFARVRNSSWVEFVWRERGLTRTTTWRDSITGARNTSDAALQKRFLHAGRSAQTCLQRPGEEQRKGSRCDGGNRRTAIIQTTTAAAADGTRTSTIDDDKIAHRGARHTDPDSGRFVPEFDLPRRRFVLQWRNHLGGGGRRAKHSEGGERRIEWGQRYVDYLCKIVIKAVIFSLLLSALEVFALYGTAF